MMVQLQMEVGGGRGGQAYVGNLNWGVSFSKVGNFSGSKSHSENCLVFVCISQFLKMFSTEEDKK